MIFSDIYEFLYNKHNRVMLIITARNKLEHYYLAHAHCKGQKCLHCLSKELHSPIWKLWPFEPLTWKKRRTKKNNWFFEPHYITQPIISLSTSITLTIPLWKHLWDIICKVQRFKRAHRLMRGTDSNVICTHYSCTSL